jgi:hypothetical protein
MKKFSNITEKNNNISGNLLVNMMNDIDYLISNLEYLKSFLDKNKDTGGIEIYQKLVRVHTDIQLLSGKIKPKK